jgi:hypothetical protein
MERITLFGIIDVELESTGAGTLTLSTDLPGNAMVVRETKPIAATVSRTVVRFRLAGTTKGHLYNLKIQPNNGVVMRIFSAKIWARVMPGEWAWYAVPVPATGDWTEAKLPIPPMGEWAAQPLPIPPTPADWTPQPLPIKPTPQNPEWVNIPIDE